MSQGGRWLFAAILLLLERSAFSQISEFCYSSLDCRGERLSGVSATLSSCCVPGGGLSYGSSEACFNCYSEETITTEGNRFVAGFFGNLQLIPGVSRRVVRISVDSISGEPTEFVVDALGDPQTFSTPTDSEVVLDSNQLTLSPSERDKGILIYSVGGEQLSVIAYAEELQSADAFKVLPIVRLPVNEYEYYAVSVPRAMIPFDIDDDYGEDYEPLIEFEAIEGQSAIVIVTTEDDTTLQITLTQSVSVESALDLMAQVPSGVIQAGETVTINLSGSVQTLYLSSDDDLSGSRVVADKPIAFISGHECGNVPRNVTYCDHMIEQIPPTATWGTSFISAPFAQRTSGDCFKIVASRDGTDVSASCTNGNLISFSLNQGGVEVLNISSLSTCYFESSEPILLVQLSASSNVERVFEGDPSMVVIPATEQYRDRYIIQSFESRASTGGLYFLNILVPFGSSLDGVRLNSVPVVTEGTDVVTVNCPQREDLCASSILVAGADNSPVLSHVDGSPINAIAYWYNFRVAYSYFAGMTQRPIALPAVSFSTDMFSAFENTTVSAIVLQREGNVALSAVVRVQTNQLSSDDAAIAGEDFEHVNTTVQFAVGQTEAMVLVPLIDDVFPESPEVFEVFLSASSGVYIQSPAVATVTINDRDPDLLVMNVSFSEPSVPVREGEGVLSFTLEKTEGAVGPVSVRVFTVSGSAEDGLDFEGIDQMVTFEMEDLVYEGAILILDNDALEEDEQFQLMIEAIPGEFPVNVQQDTQTVNITDNDRVVFGFDSCTFAIFEPDEFNVPIEIPVRLISGSLDRRVSLFVSNQSGSAQGGEDYFFNRAQLDFDGNFVGRSFSVLITFDNIVESNETFSLILELSPEDVGSGSIILGRSELQITIVDTDVASIGIIGDRTTVREGDSNPRLRIGVLDGNIGREVIIFYSTFNINATSEMDYMSQRDVPLPLTPEQPVRDIVLQIRDDLEYEGDQPESFAVQLSLLTGDNAERIRVRESVLEIFIEDNDPRPVPLVGFAESSYTTVEESESVILLVTSEGTNPSPVVISYTVNVENTQDVMRTSGSITLLSGAVLAAVTIPLTQDTTPEPTESFTVTLSAGDDVQLTISTTTVTVLNTDVVVCGPLSAPTNGRVDTSGGTSAGSVTTYTCDQGYNLNGSPVRVCGNDAQWTPEAPTCEIIANCGPLPSPANGQVDTSGGFSVGSIAVYTCNVGYNLNGSSARICGNDAQWTPEEPTCELVLITTGCGRLFDPLNGTVVVSGQNEGDAASYTCDEGFRLSGPSTRMCIQGTWIPQQPCCERVILPPNPPVIFTIGEVGSTTAELVWRQDMSVVSNYTLDILYLGSCTPFNTTRILPGNLRSLDLTDLNEGGDYQVVLRALNVGGQSEGTAQLFFNTDFDVPSGAPLSLRPTAISNTSVTLQWDEVNCLDQNGQISAYLLRYFPTSMPNSIVPLVANRRIQTIFGLQPGTSYTFEVAAAFGRGSGPFASLQVTTVANPPPSSGNGTVCSDGDLRLVNGANEFEGRVEICFRGAWGTVCDDIWGVTEANVVCRQLGHSDQGAVPCGEACFGQGVGPILLDDVTCQGREQRLDQCESGAGFGFCLDNCNHGEDAGVTCQPMQPAIECPSLLAINAMIIYAPDVMPNFELGTTATYECDAGFFLNETTGNRVRTCEDGDGFGMWSGTEPSCVAIQCPELAPIDNGIITYGPDTAPNFDLGTVATYRCDRGFFLDLSMGSEMRTCEDDDGMDNIGVWSGMEPSCVPPMQDAACYTGLRCDGDIIALGARECCLQTPGLSYSVNGQCIDCIAFGFFASSLAGIERGPAYALEIGYIKRPPSVNQVIRGNIQIVPGTADINEDFTISTMTYTGTATRNETLNIQFRVDNVAQEAVETAQLQLSILAGISPPSNLIIQDTLTLEIQDSDIVQFQFTDDSYRSNEPALQINAVVSKTLRIANPITFQVFPYTVQQAEDLGLISDSSLRIPPDDNRFSPNRAQSDRTDRPPDFNPAVLTVTFEADEDLSIPVNDMPVPVPINDDDIDEAQEEVFIINLRLQSSVNPGGIQIDRNLSLCRINDDDVIQIGFQNSSYTFPEPPFLESHVIYLEKQDGVRTEQTYRVIIQSSQSTPSFGISNALPFDRVNDNDYTILLGDPTDTITPEFLPEDQLFPFQFFLFGDDLAEGLEAFQVSVFPDVTPDAPAYFTPSPGVLFPTTFIVITDDDPIIVGFEQNFTVSENIGSFEVCFRVLNPPDDNALPVSIDLVVDTMGESAGESDYMPIRSSQLDVFESLSADRRRACFNVGITADSVREDTEVFSLVLSLDLFVPQAVRDVVIIEPGVIYVQIEDVTPVPTERPTIETCVDGAVRLITEELDYATDEPLSFIEGRVEVCVGGVWGTICDDAWDNADATVVCRQLGHSDQGAFAHSGGVFPSAPESTPIHYDNVQCRGTELFLRICPLSTDTSGCNHTEDAGVTCQLGLPDY